MKDDTISRRAALKGLEDLNIASWYELNEHSNEAYHEIKQMLETLPTVDAVPVVHGRWNCSDDAYESAVCSVCGWDTTEPWAHIKEWFNFCPHCGADMRKDGDHHES